jgi:hypothetical protein
MVEASCHCGAVKLEAPHPPTKVTSCNCSICRRLGTLWAYYPPAEIRVVGETATYVWGDKTIAFHHCRTCGCTTHWSPIDPKGEHMGVNSRLMDPAIVASARTRFVNGADDTWTERDE